MGRINGARLHFSTMMQKSGQAKNGAWPHLFCIYSEKQERQRKEYKKRLRLRRSARNDTFIFYIITESVAELLSNYNRPLFNERSPVPLNQLFNIFSTSSLSTSRI